MTTSSSLTRRVRLASLVLGTLGVLTAIAAQSAPTRLPPIVTTATRTPSAPRTIGAAVDVIPAAELARRQFASLAGALGGAAGAPVFASGATGALASVFLRGANSNQTLFLVDGIRLNDPNTDYAVFLGGAALGASDSLEIARGPQGTLYGGEAVGGVVSLRAGRGTGAPAGRVALEAGSFGTMHGAVALQGERGASAYTFSLQGGRTANERPNNAFESSHAVLRLDRAISSRLAAGGTLRWFHGNYGDPGDRYTNDPDNRSREDNVLGTVFVDFQPRATLKGRVMAGGQARRFVSENPSPDGGVQVTVVENRRALLDAQATFSGAERHRLTAGLTTEANHARNTGFGEIDERQALVAVFVQDEFSPRDDVFLTAGLRQDDFDTFGRALTGRGTAAWLPAGRQAKLRATYGTAFRSPSFLDLFGRSAFYNGNPQLRPERARGWDAGADYYLLQERGVLSATWFETSFTDLIAGTPDFRSVENIQRARTRGLELSVKAPLPGEIALQAGYTWLEAANLTAGTRLLRRPAHRAVVDLSRVLGRGFSLGGGVTWTAQREDVHAATYATIDGEDFTLVRVYGAWEISSNIAVRLRLENLLDERYEEVNGYPATGFGAFTGVEWRF